MTEKPDINNLKRQIVEEVLTQASFDGWNNNTLEDAAESIGQPRNMAYVCFPDGISELIAYYGELVDERMVQELGNKSLENMKIRERIATAVMTRLAIYDEHKEAVRQLVGRYVFPTRAPIALGNIAKTVDKMWIAAGDNSTDFNYYTKRLMLGGVYTSTVFYWLRDESEDYADTRAFLDRRIADVMKIEKAKAKCKTMFSSKFAGMKG